MSAKRLLLLWCAVLASFCVEAQTADSLSLKGDSLSLSRDSLSIGSIYYHHTSESYFIDSFFQIEDNLVDVHYFSPLKRTDNGFFQQLSTYGSPSQSTLYDLNTSFLQYQPNIYSPYTYNKGNIKFYQLHKPFSELYYSNDLNSTQAFHIIHSQNVYRGLNIGLQYDVDYADGTFVNSQVMNQFFNATANYISPKGTYRAEAAYIRNRAYTNESGGINDAAFLADSFPSPAAYPVLLTASYTQFKSADFFLSQSLRLPKSLGAVTLTNSFDNNTRIYHDAQSIDTTLSFDNKKLTNTLSYSSVAKFLPLNAGIRHDYNLFADRNMSEKTSLFTPFARLDYALKRFHFKAYGEKTISNNLFGDNSLATISANLAFDTINRNKVFASLSYKTAAADFFYRHNNTTNYQWTNDFNSIKTTKLSIGTSLLGILTLNLNYFALSDNVWLSQSLQPIQKEGNTNVYQAILSNKFTLGAFGFIGTAAVQYADDEKAVPLPLLQVKQTAYVEFFLFSKKLKTQIGLDFYYNTAFYADTYSPELGSFYRQQERKVGNYLYTDLFVGVQISSVNLFLALTHPYAGLLGNDYFQTLHYPSEALSFRWGLSWKFID
ncbi:MAG: putative porin [Bacteroidales bacterium]|jgi:hypothetical protein|nr:putative porin [Bacteroidales bacterium]